MSQYTRFFNFTTRPFEPSAKRPPVLGTESLKDAFREIQAALAEDVPVILLQGPSGVGKSSLARVLPKLLARERRTLLMKSPCLERLKEALEEIKAAPEADPSTPITPTFVVDDAGSASDDFLEQLAATLTDWTGSPGLSCILIRNSLTHDEEPSPALASLLEGLISQEIELAPLSMTGTKRYVEKHIQRVGGNSEELFPEEVIRAIHTRAEGVPREISRVCEKLLKRAAREQSKSLDSDWLEDLSPEPSSGESAGVESHVAFPMNAGSPAKAEEDIESPAEEEGTAFAEAEIRTESGIPHESPSIAESHPRKNRIHLFLKLAIPALILLMAATFSFWLYASKHERKTPLSQENTSTPTAPILNPETTARPQITPAKAVPPQALDRPLPALALRTQGKSTGLGPLAWPAPQDTLLLPPIHAEAPALWLDNQKLLNQIRSSVEKSPRRPPERRVE